MNNKKKGIIAVGLAAVLSAGYLLTREPETKQEPKRAPVVVVPTPSPQQPIETEQAKPIAKISQLKAKPVKKTPQPVATKPIGPSISLHWPGEKLGTFRIPPGLMVVVTANPEPRKRDGLYCESLIFAPCWREVNGERWQFNRCMKKIDQPPDRFGLTYRFEPDASCAWQKSKA